MEVTTRVVLLLLALPSGGRPWPRHTIDDSSRGADGVRLADADGDGRLDIATGWEEGGVVRVYFHPGAAKVRQPWPRVEVGAVQSPEDAVLVDLDGDGAFDVVSSCEGATRTVFVHWAPAEKARYREPSAWQTTPLPASAGRAQWMFCVPVQIDGRHGVDLLCGAKGEGAEVGWFEAPAKPRELQEWRWRPLSRAGWIMTLLPCDFDGDGDLDVLLSDRNGDLRGVRWLENAGRLDVRSDAEWSSHTIGGADLELLFLTRADLDGDGRAEILCPARRGPLLVLRQEPAGSRWIREEIPLPAEAGTGKAAAVGDLDRDGQAEIVLTCENALGPKPGVFSLRRGTTSWTAGTISGPEGVKLDLVELLDLDADGDLDVLTCEESEGLGVIWYENPAR